MSVCLSHPELFNLGLNITLREVLYVGQLEVHLRQPHQDAVSGRLKLLPLADEVLNEQSETYKQPCFIVFLYLFKLTEVVS